MAWAPDYATADELASYLRITDDVDDVELALANTSASRAIDHSCNRQFGQIDAPEQRTYYARPDYRGGYWVVDVDDFMAVTGVGIVVDGTDVTEYQLEPVNAAQMDRPFTRVAFTADSEAQPTVHPHEVLMTARWGWSAVPDTVHQANLLQASRFFKRRDAPFGVAGSPDTGSEMRLLAKVDPDVAVMLRDYMRLRAVA
jgi:hypothetical protein